MKGMSDKIQKIFPFKRVRGNHFIFVYKKIDLENVTDSELLISLKKNLGVDDDSKWSYLIQIHTNIQNEADLYAYVRLKERFDVHKKTMLDLEFKEKSVKFEGLCLVVPPQHNCLALLCVLKGNNIHTRNLTNFEESFFTNIKEELKHCSENSKELDLTKSDYKETYTVKNKEKIQINKQHDNKKKSFRIKTFKL